MYYADTDIGTSRKNEPKSTLEKLELDIYSVKLIHLVLFYNQEKEFNILINKP